LHEYSGGNSFITLTYRDKDVCDAAQLKAGHHIRDDWCLDAPSLYPPMAGVSHFQRFMKRLRKAKCYYPKDHEKANKLIPGSAIKFYMCGEYGKNCKHGLDLELVQCPFCNVGRPHYHAILFNCSFPDKREYAVQNGVTRFTSDILQELWPYGFVDVGDVTVNSAGYVARYIMKKVTGDAADQWYESVDLNGEITKCPHEYSTMSNGIGAEWYEKFKDDVFPSDEVPVPGMGVMKGVPRYYEERLRKEAEADYDMIKARRARYKLDNPEEFESERLWSKYKVKKAQTSDLKRNL
jgi:hypothetical protein